MDKDVKFINNGNSLEFNRDGFAVNPNLPVGVRGENVAFFTADFRNVLLTITGTGSVFVLGSVQKNPPDFQSPSTIDNSWATIVTADYSVKDTYYDGNVGVDVADSTKIVELNTNLLTWIAIVAVPEKDGTVDVLMTVTNNQ